MEETGVSVAQPTSSYQEGNRNGDGQVDGEGVGEALYHYFTGELSEDVGEVGGEDVDEEDVEGGVVAGGHDYVVPGGDDLRDVRRGGASEGRFDFEDGYHVFAPAFGEVGEEELDLAFLDHYDEEDGEEEAEALPYGDEYVREVPRLLEAFLDFAQTFDEGQG